MKNIFVHHGRAFALGGRLKAPEETDIQPQAFALLPGVGGSHSSRQESYSHSGIYFRSAFSSVSGTIRQGSPTVHVTQVQATVHDLNILGFITAKSITAHLVATTKADLQDDGLTMDESTGLGLGLGPVPEFNFYATAAEDLKVNGRPIDLGNRIQSPGGEHPADEVVRRLTGLYRGCRGIRLVSTLCQMVRNDEAVKNNRRLLSIEGPKSRTDISRSEITPIKLPGFGRVYVAELLYDPFVCELNMLRVEMDEGTFQGELLIGSVRGGPSCFPKE